MIVGTAGHVDHGKTTLIKALTGIDTDRLKEEKERGLSIELGFAHIDLPCGQRAGIVDVPGHERFVRTMLAGATGMDMALFVVAADEGVMPQTVEHLEILQLLRVKRGVIVLTKADLVEFAWLEMVRQDVEQAVRGTFLEGAPMVPVSAVTGQGLDHLVAAMDEVARQSQERDASSPCRLPIDRVFTMPGFGTVVTGTLAHGTIALGDRLEVLPAGLQARARGVQVHEEARERAVAGERVAVNLAGLELAQVSRGHVVAAPGIFRPTSLMDAMVDILPSARKPVKRGARVRVHIFTAELIARFVPLQAAQLPPGGSGPVQLRLEAETVAAPGDRLVIRSFSPMRTIGGGEIVDAHPPRRPHAERLASGASVEDVVAQAAAQAPRLVLDREAVAQRLGVPVERVVQAVDALVQRGAIVLLEPEAMAVAASRYSALLDEIESALRVFHVKHSLLLGLTHEQIRSSLSVTLEPRVVQHALSDLVEQGRASRKAEKFMLAGHQVQFSPAQRALADRIERAFLREPFSPPDLAQVVASLSSNEGQAVADALLEMGTLRSVSGVIFHSKALDKARETLVDYLRRNETTTVATFRSLLQTSRKYAVPLLEFFDSAGITRRTGDERRLGPRAIAR